MFLKVFNHSKKDKSMAVTSMIIILLFFSFVNIRFENRFYELNKLSINGFIDTETDSIKFRFKLRPKSILEERKLLQWQIE
jgi:hypothetical protein